MSDQPLAGAVALVTGASSGIGEGIARLLSRLGAAVALVARREAELRRVAQDLTAGGGVAAVVVADLAVVDEGAAVVDRVTSALGQVDVLANCAGVVESQPLHELAADSWDRAFAVNVRAPALLVASVLPGMRERRRGWIINMSSEAGVMTYSGMGAYGVSKHALCALSDLIQEENQEFGIKTWAICPGDVATARAVQLSAPLEVERFLDVEDVLDVVRVLLTQRPNVTLGPTILVRPTLDPNRR